MKFTRDQLGKFAREGLAICLILAAALVFYSFIVGQNVLHFAIQTAAYSLLPLLCAVIALRASRLWLSWLALVIGWAPILLLFYGLLSV